MVGTPVGMLHRRKENTMDDIKAIERYLIGRYLQETDVSLADVPRRRDALLYLALREELAVMDRPLYETVILAGDKGPVFPEIPVRTSEKALKLTLECLYGMRSVYKGGLFPGVSPEGMNRIQNVVITYKKAMKICRRWSWSRFRGSRLENQEGHTTSTIFGKTPRIFVLMTMPGICITTNPIRGWKPVIANKKHVIEIYFDEIFLLKAMNVLMYKKARSGLFFCDSMGVTETIHCLANDIEEQPVV